MSSQISPSGAATGAPLHSSLLRFCTAPLALYQCLDGSLQLNDAARRLLDSSCASRTEPNLSTLVSAQPGNWLPVPNLPGVSARIEGRDEEHVLFRLQGAGIWSETALEVVYERFPGMLVVQDADGRILRCSALFLEKLGFTENQVLGKTFAELLPPALVSSYQKAFANCRNSGNDRLRLILPVSGASGQVDLILHHCQRASDGDEAVITILHDRTTLASMEVALERRDALLQAASRAAQLLLSESRNFDETVMQVLEILGEATGTDRVYVWNIHPSPHPDINPELHTSQLYEWSRGAEPVQGTEICINRPVSETMPTWIDTFMQGKCVNSLVRNMHELEQEQLRPQGIISILTAPIMIHGELWGFIGFDDCHSEYVWSRSEEHILQTAGTLIGTSIHNQRIHTELHESEDRFRIVAEATGEIIWTLDAKGNIDYVSDRVEVVLGYRPDELIGRDWKHLVYDPDEFALSATLDAPIVRDYEARIRCKDGGFRWMRQSCKFIFDDKGNMLRCFGTSLDKTAMHEAQDELRKAKEALQKANLQLRKAAKRANELAREAQKANLSKSEFLANMSHEIRTPMNAIMGMIDLVMRTPLDVKQRKYLEKVDFASRNLLNIINDILDFSKVEAGKLDMESVSFELESVVRDVRDLVLHHLSGKKIVFSVIVEPGIRDAYIGDPLRLSQVLINLTTNAIKFTEEGKVTIRCEEAESDEKQALIRISVTDTGIGMSEDQRERLFKPFHQADMSTTRKFGGTGLGLALCKKLTQLMGGDIACESAPGKGSTFTFTCRLGLSESGDRDASTALKNIRTFVVTADDVVADMVTEHLHGFGCSLTQRFRGMAEVEGLLPGEEGKPDLVILDMDSVALPGSGALDTLSHTMGGKLICLTRDTQPRVPAEAVLVRYPMTMSTLYEAVTGRFAMRIPAASESLEAGRSETDFTGMRVLLVEDNDINQLVAVELLGQAGILVTVAENGLEALNILEKDDFDAVLMDIQMPVMDGLAATRKIRAQPRFAALPIIAMTAHAMASDREKSIKAGMNAHITKPINTMELFRCLGSFLARSARDECQGASPGGCSQ